MPSSTLASYETEAEILTAAAQSKGRRLTFASKSAAFRFRFRLYDARIAFRKRSQTALPPSDPAYGTSPWEQLSVKNPYQNGEVWILEVINMANSGPLKDEEISIDHAQETPKPLQVDDLTTDDLFPAPDKTPG